MNNFSSHQSRVNFLSDSDSAGQGVASGLQNGGGSYVSVKTPSSRQAGSYVTTSAPQGGRPGSYVSTRVKASGPVGSYTDSAPRA